MSKNEWAVKEPYLSLFMGLLLGQQLRESVAQLKRQKEKARAALAETERELTNCRSGILGLRNWKEFKFNKN